MKVYMVLFDWSITDDEGIEIELFDSYEKAITRFDAIIDDEQNPDIGWVGESDHQAFHELLDKFNLELQEAIAADKTGDGFIRDMFYWSRQ